MRHIDNDHLAEVQISQLIRDKTLSGELKLVDKTPVFKSFQNTMIKKCRPINVLVVFSKIFERIMEKQTNDYIEQSLSKYLCCYNEM